MASKVLTTLLFAPFCVPAIADTPFVQLSGSIVKDNMPAAKFAVSVSSGQTSRIVLGDGTQLEFSTHRSGSKDGETVIRLLDASGKLLHKESAPGELLSKSVQYVLCGSAVTFISPARETAPPCQKS